MNQAAVDISRAIDGRAAGLEVNSEGEIYISMDRIEEVYRRAMDSGELTERAVLNRAEYIGWATGFMTALNIRHYEKNNRFKDMDSFEKYNDVYNEIMGSCNYIDKEGLQNDFAFATFLIFHSLTQQNQ